MKVIFIKSVFIFFFIFSSVSAQNLKLKSYETYLQNLDATKYYSTSIAAKKYKELFSSESFSVKDSAFVLFKKFYDNVSKKLNDLHDGDNTDYLVLFYDTKNGEKVQIPDIILNYRNDLINNGFDIAISEGSTWIKEDWNFISKNFYNVISPNMKEYCSFLNLVIREGTEEDGGFTITPTRLAERIIWLEKFRNLNPKFILNNECNSHYKYFLYLLLNGSDHSSILNEKDTINQNFIDAYNYIILEHSKSKTAKLVSPFYQFLKNKQEKKAYDLVEKYKKEGLIEY